MNETKLRLSLSVPGAQLLSPQECGENPKDSFNTHIIPISYHTKKGKFIRENITVKTRKHKLVKQSISISKDAYNYMIDPECPPDGRTAKKVYITKTIKQPNGKPKKVTKESTVWAQYTIKQRLEWHLSRIAADLRAVSFTYEVFED